MKWNKKQPSGMTEVGDAAFKKATDQSKSPSDENYSTVPLVIPGFKPMPRSGGRDKHEKYSSSTVRTGEQTNKWQKEKNVNRGENRLAPGAKLLGED
jgi:hypothetical protein